MVVSDQLNRFSVTSEKEGKQETSVKLIVVFQCYAYMCACWIYMQTVKHHSLKTHAFDLWEN